MNKTVEISLEPVTSSLNGDTIKVGDEVIYVSVCTKTSYIQRGKFLGTRVSKRTYTQTWAREPRQVTQVSITYMIETDKGKKTNLHYARMMQPTSPITSLVGARL